MSDAMMRSIAIGAIALSVIVAVFACYVILRMPAWLGLMMAD